VRSSDHHSEHGHRELEIGEQVPVQILDLAHAASRRQIVLDLLLRYVEHYPLDDLAGGSMLMVNWDDVAQRFDPSPRAPRG